MKNILMAIWLVLGSVAGTLAQDTNQAKIAKERADRLTDRMIRELRLNNFQGNRLRAINQDKVIKMMAIEQQYAHNPALVDKNCQGICKERDQELERFLSFDQYGKYYGNRAEFYKYDKDFAAKIGLAKPGDAANPLNKTLSTKPNAANATAADPVLKPATDK